MIAVASQCGVDVLGLASARKRLKSERYPANIYLLGGGAELPKRELCDQEKGAVALKPREFGVRNFAITCGRTGPEPEHKYTIK
jgi:hypothetical protein